MMNFDTLTTNMPWLDLLLVALLCATLAYAYMLNQRLRYLRQNADKLATLTREFTEATDTANLATMNLKTAAAAASERLEEATKRAESVYSDLDFLISRAEKATIGLETTVAPARASSPEPQPTAAVEKVERQESLQESPLASSEKQDSQQGSPKSSMAANELLDVINAARKMQG